MFIEWSTQSQLSHNPVTGLQTVDIEAPLVVSAHDQYREPHHSILSASIKFIDTRLFLWPLFTVAGPGAKMVSKIDIQKMFKEIYMKRVCTESI